MEITPPIDTTGIDHYTVNVRDQPKKFCNTSHGAKFCVITGLNPATKYTFQARACLSDANLRACGQPTENTTWTTPTGQSTLFFVVCTKYSRGNPSRFHYKGPPEAPSLQSRTTNSLVISFAKVPGAEPLVYKVRISSNGSQMSSTSSCETSGQVCSVSGLEAGWEYSLTIYACIAESFCGRDSPPLITKSLPAPPRGIELVPVSTTELTATITPSEDLHGVDHYNIQLTPGPKECTPLGSPPSCSFTGLTAATLYTAVGRACLAGNDSNACSSSVQASTWTKAAGMVYCRLKNQHELHSLLRRLLFNIDYSSTNNSLIVKFAPLGNGLEKIIQFKAYDVNEASKHHCEQIPPSMQCTVSGLKPATSYLIRIDVCIILPFNWQKYGEETMWTLPNGRILIFQIKIYKF